MSIETLSAAPVTSYQSITPVKSVPVADKADVFTGNSGLQTETAATSAAVDMELKDSYSGNLDKNLKDQPSEADMKTASKDINKMINKNTIAEFGYHEATHRITIKIKDKNTNEVIKEIPSEKALEMLEKAWELAGIMVDEKR